MSGFLHKHALLLWLLAGLHLAGASAVAVVIHFDKGGVAAAVVFDALIYAAAALVGMWAGLARHSKLAGFAGVGASMSLIAALVSGSLWHSMSGPMGPGNDFWVTVWLVLFQLALATLSMAAVVAAMLALRRRGVAIVVQPAPEARELEPIRFSLRQLFLLTLAIGVMIQLGPFVRQWFNDYRSYTASLAALGSGGLVLGAVGLTGLWTVFGGGNSAVRIGAALLLAAALGTLPPYYFPRLLTDDVAASVAATILEWLLVTATLAAVRAGGFRLVRRT